MPSSATKQALIFNATRTGLGFAGGLLRQVPSEGNSHSRCHFPCILSRKAVVAAMWDLVRGFPMPDHTQEFIQFAIEKQVLRFGEFKTKAGRISPYFFNAGLFNDGMSLMKLGEFYAAAIVKSGIHFDMLFGPAYKGIPLVSSIVITFAKNGHNVPYAFNRKEAKDHGEGGTIIGAPLKGRVLIIDDVISAGTSVRESVDLIAASGATPCGVAIALDRQ